MKGGRPGSRPATNMIWIIGLYLCVLQEVKGMISSESMRVCTAKMEVHDVQCVRRGDPKTVKKENNGMLGATKIDVPNEDGEEKNVEIEANDANADETADKERYADNVNDEEETAEQAEKKEDENDDEREYFSYQQMSELHEIGWYAMKNEDQLTGQGNVKENENELVETGLGGGIELKMIGIGDERKGFQQVKWTDQGNVKENENELVETGLVGVDSEYTQENKRKQPKIGNRNGKSFLQVTRKHYGYRVKENRESRGDRSRVKNNHEEKRSQWVPTYSVPSNHEEKRSQWVSTYSVPSNHEEKTSQWVPTYSVPSNHEKKTLTNKREIRCRMKHNGERPRVQNNREKRQKEYVGSRVEHNHEEKPLKNVGSSNAPKQGRVLDIAGSRQSHTFEKPAQYYIGQDGHDRQDEYMKDVDGKAQYRKNFGSTNAPKHGRVLESVASRQYVVPDRPPDNG